MNATALLVSQIQFAFAISSHMIFPAFAIGLAAWLTARGTTLSAFCSGLCLGYALLGAGWLVNKCEGEVQDAAWRPIPSLALGVLAFLAIATPSSATRFSEARWARLQGTTRRSLTK
jgi:cytochrome bd-type quinol oxidase subunit 2